MKPGLLQQLKEAPETFGCYLFKDSDEQVLYVGKAKNIKLRVQAYRKPSGDGRRRLVALWEAANTVEFRVTQTENEALILEEQLIKRLQPPMNVLLKDDKSFLYLTIPSGHPFPPIRLARKPCKEGVSFGPYPSAQKTRETKRFLKQAFGLRDCSDATISNRSRPCLQKEVGLCLGPCVTMPIDADYDVAVQEAKEVLSGKVGGFIRTEKKLMAAASVEQEYEAALHSRNRISALEYLRDPQRVRATGKEDFDVLGLDVRGAFSILEYRNGEWANTRHGKIPFFQSISHAVEMVLLGAYRKEADIPSEILLPQFPESKKSLEFRLTEKRGRTVSLVCPIRGMRRRLVRLAESNALLVKTPDRRHGWQEISQGLAGLFGCQGPRVVDCVDVSHTQGKETVASRVRFIEGKAALSSWRRYSLAGKVKNNDFEAMKIVLSKILKSSAKDGCADWIVLDGGPPQLKAGESKISTGGGTSTLFALAKGRKGYSGSVGKERIYKSGIKDPVFLIPDSPERLFLEHVRNEAHRFAVSYHRKRRDKLQIQLEKVPGIGSVKSQKIMRWCRGDMSKLRNTTAEKLAETSGLNLKLAQNLVRYLAKNNS